MNLVANQKLLNSVVPKALTFVFTIFLSSHVDSQINSYLGEQSLNMSEILNPGGNFDASTTGLSYGKVSMVTYPRAKMGYIRKCTMHLLVVEQQVVRVVVVTRTKRQTMRLMKQAITQYGTQGIFSFGAYIDTSEWISNDQNYLVKYVQVKGQRWGMLTVQDTN